MNLRRIQTVKNEKCIFLWRRTPTVILHRLRIFHDQWPFRNVIAVDKQILKYKNLVFINLAQEKTKNQSKSKFSKKSIDVPILQYCEAVSPVYQNQAIQRLPASQPQKRSGNQAKRHKKCSIREESASETFSPPLNYDFAQNMAANLEDINFGLTPVDEPYPSTESPSIVKMETSEPAHQTFDPQPFFSANVTPLSVPTAPTPPTSKSEPNLSAVRAFSGITVKTGVKSAAVPQASISGSPGKQSLRAVFTNFHAQQASRMVPEIARSIGAGGQKVN